jgi:type IV pilus assembly protein PilB
MLKQPDEKFGELLVNQGMLTPEQLDLAMRKKRSSGEELATTVVKGGWAGADQVLRLFADFLEIPFLELGDYNIDPAALATLPKEKCHKYGVLPVFLIGNVLTVATSEPTDVGLIDAIRSETGLAVEPAVSTPEAIAAALEHHFGPNLQLDGAMDAVIQKIQQEAKPEEDKKSADNLKKIAEDAPVIQLVNLIIGQAIRDGASDIHVEPDEDCLRVRNRIDGVLRETLLPPKNLQAAITSRIKILSEMDIAESRIPQDGRFQVTMEERVVDIRCSMLPTVYGENIVMRILDKGSLMLNLEDLGLSPEMLKRLKSILASSYGIILVTGPTGSGKTTTLYSCLNNLNNADVNIITVEDPVEYRLKLIRQAHVNVKAGLTFANGLRSILRQDPDIVMVGEIRDSETAKIAVEAALTGHLVLSTLHTNDAPGALTRLSEMGVEPFLISSSTVGVIAQRLVRKICSKCRVSYHPSVELLQELGINAQQAKAPSGREWVFYRGQGCANCKNSGYRGRCGIYEIMTMDEEIRKLCLQHASTDQIKKAALKAGMRTLRQDGLFKVLRGITTIEEVIQATNID